MVSEAKLSGSNVKTFIYAGNATFTLVSCRTGARFTYHIEKAEESKTWSGQTATWFVSVLTGPSNESDYQYCGLIQNGLFRTTKGSKISPTATSVVAIRWFVERLERGEVDGVEVWHCGRCGKCGRKLTVPESIASGIGPICAEGEKDGN